LLRVDENNEATLTELTIYDKFRLRNQRLGITRIMFQPGTAFHKALQSNEYRHSPFKYIQGACASTFVICDLLERKEVTIAGLKYTNQFRLVKENESYYSEYDGVGNTIKVDYGHPSTPYEYS
jgi:hypothetical protein